MPSPTSLAFVCVRNAGRSQMAAAFAEREAGVQFEAGVQCWSRSDERHRRERDARGLDVEILTGGTRPADHVHPVVVDVMAEVGIDLTDRTPREIAFEEVRRADYVVTMGCSADDVCPAGWTGENRDWALDDPAGRPAEEVAAIRDEIERRVVDLFDELADGQ